MLCYDAPKQKESQLIYFIFHKHLKIYFTIRKQSLASYSSVIIVESQPLAEIVRFVYGTIEDHGV